MCVWIQRKICFCSVLLDDLHLQLQVISAYVEKLMTSYNSV